MEKSRLIKEFTQDSVTTLYKFTVLNNLPLRVNESQSILSIITILVSVKLTAFGLIKTKILNWKNSPKLKEIWFHLKTWKARNENPFIGLSDKK